MAAVVAYLLSGFLFLLFAVAVVMVLKGDKHTAEHPVAHLVFIVLCGAGAWAAAWLGGI